MTTPVLIDQIFYFFLESPLGIGLVIIGVIVFMAWHFGLFKVRPEKFKSETLKDILLKDLKPRMVVLASKSKWKLMYNYNIVGKIRRITEGSFMFWTIEDQQTKIEKHKKKIGFDAYAKLDKKPKFLTEIANLTYMMVGGNKWLSWIPVIGKSYQPNFFVINSDFVKIESSSKIITISNNAHLYPFGEIWIADKRTERYFTELISRATLESELEVRTNTPKRWTFYGEQRAGTAILTEEKQRLEDEKWAKARDYGQEV